MCRICDVPPETFQAGGADRLVCPGCGVGAGREVALYRAGKLAGCEVIAGHLDRVIRLLAGAKGAGSVPGPLPELAVPDFVFRQGLDAD